MDATRHLILYDGLCAMCNGFVRFVVRLDAGDVFRFAPLQGAAGATVITRQPTVNAGMNTVYVVRNYETPNPQILSRSDAALFVLQELGGFWKAMARAASKLPLSLRDGIYNFVARNRYHLARKLDACPLAAPQDNHRFLP